MCADGPGWEKADGWISLCEILNNCVIIRRTAYQEGRGRDQQFTCQFYIFGGPPCTADVPNDAGIFENVEQPYLLVRCLQLRMDDSQAGQEPWRHLTDGTY